MILDYLNRREIYNSLSPVFAEAMDFALSVKDKPVGRYEQGDYFALVQEMDTVALADKKFELHRKYLDVHIVLSGEEVIEYEDITLLTPGDEYNAEKDIQRLTGTGCPVVVKEGMFCLVFDHDGHKTGCFLEKTGKLRKIVLKIPQAETTLH